jgi:hypothetical protein
MNGCAKRRRNSPAVRAAGRKRAAPPNRSEKLGLVRVALYSRTSPLAGARVSIQGSLVMRFAQALASEVEGHTVSSSIRCGPDKLGCGCLYCNEIPVETALKHCVSSKAKGPGSGQGLYDSVSASSAHATTAWLGGLVAPTPARSTAAKSHEACSDKYDRSRLRNIGRRAVGANNALA